MMWINILLVIWTSCYNTYGETAADFTYVSGHGQVVQATVGEDAVLPCDADSTIDLADLPVEWSRLDSQHHVYYQRNRGELDGDKDPSYINRTSLFNDKGNVSLKLSRVQPSDEGIYTCRIKNKVSNVQLNVATVVKVSMELKDDTITCSSRGIYPEPRLSWSTSPPTNHIFYNSTTMTKTTEGLYDVSSSLAFTAKDSQLNYTCSVGTERGGNTATLRQLPPVRCYDSVEVEIPCKAPSSALKDCSITWSFNHSETILSYSSSSRLPLVQDQWKEGVKGVSESGALLLSASSGKLEGVYKCELCYADDTYVAYTTLKMEQKPGDSVRGPVGVNLAAVVAAVVAAATAAAAAIYWFRKWTESRNNTQQQGTPAEEETLDSPV